MKIIFLDIDGVLLKCGEVTEEVLRSREKKWKEKGVGRTGFLQWFDTDCVENFKRLLYETGAKIVISSSWRNNMEDVKESFLDADIDWNLVISRTPDTKGYGIEDGRGSEILAWLEDYSQHAKPGYEIKNWVALDDDSFDMEPVKRLGKFVQTKTPLGLTSENVDEAISILNS